MNLELEVIALYRRTFAEYRAQALWNLRVFEAPACGDALVTRALRVEGDVRALSLAEEIEPTCRAAV